MLWQLLVVAELKDLFRLPPPCVGPLFRPIGIDVEEEGEWKMERGREGGREGGSVSDGETEEKEK